MTDTDRRADVLDVLRRAERPLSVAYLAGQIPLHVNTIRFHLDHLLRSGQIERVTSSPVGAGRPPSLFRAVVGMDPQGPRHYQALAGVLTETLAGQPGGRARALNAGRSWGRDLATTEQPTDGSTRAPIPRLVALLDDLGFQPERRGRGATARIELRSCPFLELAKDRSEIVCPIHLGLMQGVLDTWGAPQTVSRLDPFVTPDRCIAHLDEGRKR